MSSMIASYPRARRSDLPHYVRKFRLESNELSAIPEPPQTPTPSRSSALIWTKVVAMSLASTGLLYFTVLLMQ